MHPSTMGAVMRLQHADNMLDRRPFKTTGVDVMVGASGTERTGHLGSPVKLRNKRRNYTESNRRPPNQPQPVCG